MSNAYQLTIPRWAVISGGQSSRSRLRNEFIHEALWAGAPIEFSHTKDHPSLHFELAYFNTRLLLALLGESGEYVRSGIGRNRWLLD
ncbi:MAG TPA: hypothetical protein VMQ61_14965 [Thermoanaerobaculia bacterium]|nr:hypothetical protein [Thermoanaerobaculia bacterium]